MKLPVHQDALEFCFDCFVRLLRICEMVADETGIAPQMTTLTDDEILDIKYTDANGVLRKYRKDKETGKLVEY